MRDLLLLAVLCGVVPLILRFPFAGLLTWIWVALMNPNREVYGFLSGAPLNLWLAVLTALAWFASSERKIVTANLFTTLLLAFSAWATLSTYFALDRAHALPVWSRTMKTVAMVVAVTMLADTRVRLQSVIWVFAASLGYFAVKGGGFTLLGGGRQHVFGPDASMISDNNNLGLALVVLLPMLEYLRMTSVRRETRLALLAAICLTIVAVLGTYSRGALIAMGVAGALYAARSRKAPALVVAAILLASLLPLMLPAGWLDRMATIQRANEDTSFQDRVAAWTTSLNIAKAHPLLGGGFVAVEQNWVALAYSSPGSLRTGRAAHSVYFEVLGETGFVGLGLYLSTVAAALLNTVLVLRIARGRADLRWAGQLARMLQISIGGFLAGGAALSMAYYDGVLLLLGSTAALLQVASAAQASSMMPAPTWKRAPASMPSSEGAAAPAIEPALAPAWARPGAGARRPR